MREFAARNSDERSCRGCSMAGATTASAVVVPPGAIRALISLSAWTCLRLLPLRADDARIFRRLRGFTRRCYDLLGRTLLYLIVRCLSVQIECLLIAIRCQPVCSRRFRDLDGIQCLVDR